MINVSRIRVMHSLAGGSRVQPWEHGIAFLSMFSVAMTSAVSHVLPQFYNNLTQFLEETLLPLMLNLKKFRRASKNMLSLIAAKQWMPNHQGGRLTSCSLLAGLSWRCSRRARDHLYMHPFSAPTVFTLHPEAAHFRPPCSAHFLSHLF